MYDITGVEKIKKIVGIVAKRYKVTSKDLLSKRRTYRISMIRHIAMKLCMSCTFNSSVQVGKYFDKGHDTVLYAVKKVDELIAKDEEFKKEIDVLERLINRMTNKEDDEHVDIRTVRGKPGVDAEVGDTFK